MATAYIAMEDEVFVVRDALTDPTPSRVLAGHDPECVAVHPADPRRVIVGTFDAGLRRSTNGGESWDHVGDVIDESAVTALTVDPTDSERWYAGTEPSAVYTSPDGGESWTRLDGLRDLPSEPEWSFPPRPDTDHVRWLEVDPSDPTHLYVAVEAGALIQTRDRGETWEDRVASAPRDSHTVATHPAEPDRAWIAAGDGYAETRDGGETWTYPEEGLDHTYCWSVALDPADPETVLVSAARGAGSAHRTPGENYVYRRVASDESDDRWTRLDDRGLPTGEGVLRTVFATRDEGGEIWAANDHGLFRTDDAGDSWDRLRVEWPDAYRGQTVRGLAVVD